MIISICSKNILIYKIGFYAYTIIEIIDIIYHLFYILLPKWINKSQKGDDFIIALNSIFNTNYEKAIIIFTVSSIFVYFIQILFICYFFQNIKIFVAYKEQI